jgi:aromatic-amino-acid transaminase
LIFDKLIEQAPDVLLQLIKLHAADSRKNKIDVGVGVYRDRNGTTPVFAAVKSAELRLLEQQVSKSYLGADGDIGSIDRLTPIVFGESLASQLGLWGFQTPGGTGALRIGADLIALSNPDAKIWYWTPTWANHPAILRAAGLQMKPFPAYHSSAVALDWGAVESALRGAKSGDVLLVQASCHNPTGADPDLVQWGKLAEIFRSVGLVPFIDSAYQGLGNGFVEDVAGLRLLVSAVDEAIIVYSCDKNFGLYRDRVGALWIKTVPEHLDATRSNLFQLARAMWSMPPDHGAAVVRLILEDATLTAQWQEELDAMRERINDVRSALAAADPRLGFIAKQRGLFAMLPLSAEQIQTLREEHAVYLAPDGRINVAGLTMTQVPQFVAALQAVMQH